MKLVLGLLIFLGLCFVLWIIDKIIHKVGMGWDTFVALLFISGGCLIVIFLFGLLGCHFFPNLVPFCSLG